jgi:predicted NBD/HSP70 family sugar kinase
VNVAVDVAVPANGVSVAVGVSVSVGVGVAVAVDVAVTVGTPAVAAELPGKRRPPARNSTAAATQTRAA